MSRAHRAACRVSDRIVPTLAVCQGLQSGSGIELNDASPKEVEDVTVVQKLGEQVPMNLALTDWMGRKVNGAAFLMARSQRL